jgi:formylglycine-generating enzyme required for sulfatase activity
MAVPTLLLEPKPESAPAPGQLPVRAHCSSPRLGEYGWFCGNSGDKTHPVGEKRPNGFGLYYMLGNVSEWCWDAYDETGHNHSGLDDPRGFDGAADRVLSRVYCGGDWAAGSADRVTGGCRAGNIGFRLVLVQSVR